MLGRDWRRPVSAPYPSVWRRLEGRRPVGGKVPSFVIQDVPEGREEELLDFMESELLVREPTCRSSGVPGDPESRAEFRAVWRDMLRSRISVVALLDEGNGAAGPRIVGANMLGVATRADKSAKQQFSGGPTRKIVGLLDRLDSMADPFQKYGVQEYMSAFGLSVAEEFKGQGLGQELLRARFDVGRAVGLKLTVTAFTAIESQVLATRLGFEVLSEVAYQDYKVDGQVVFPDIATRSAKLMAKRIE
ncbi:uncharacterized protein LOC134540563 [Bacillus rossius redtenbacheri]|uniref:uncharacterized protein LOC134540563 n=1 Tax=Bacillus rossius redtenbacheri TaxID=93214 RepID=UPI002FDEEC77